MRGMFPYVARVDYYDFPTRTVKAKYILTYGKNASSVVAQFEQDYGEDFLGVSVRVVSDEDFEFEISETIINSVVASQLISSLLAVSCITIAFSKLSGVTENAPALTEGPDKK